MWIRKVVVACVGLVVPFNLGCSPCKPFESRPAEICVQSDGGALEAGQPFALTATLSLGGASEVKCAVAVDGGAIDLTVSGDRCSPGGNAFGSAKPILVKVRAVCAVPALEAGRYTVRGIVPSSDVVVNVGGDPDAGVPVCP